MKLRVLLFLLICSFFGLWEDAGASYDINSIQNDWLVWTNTERSKVGSKPLEYSSILNSSAISWSETAKTRGYIDHKRAGQKAYYDFKKIGNWFRSKGITFKKIKRSTFSESIGWNVYSCSKEDCTQDLSKAVRETFNLYLREKGKKSAPHYKSMIEPNFSQIGLGIIVDQSKHKYYLTVHYATLALSEK